MAKEPKISFQDLETGKLEALLLKIKPLLEPADFQLLDRVICTLLLILEWLQKKNLSLRRLRRMIFGPKSEASHIVLPKDKEKDKEKEQAAAPNGQSSGTAGANPPSGKRKGHGRNGAEDYTGAERIFVAHQELQAGDLCPLCPEGGRRYDTRQPALFIRVVAQPIFRGTIYELMRLRCNLCGAVFTARAPAEAGTTKYSEEVPSMLGILCYGNGMALTRIESLQRAFGVPLPAGTQRELLWEAAQLMMPVFICLQELAAQAKELKLSPEERLKLHQTHSQPPMDALEKWAREQIEQKKVEPNSDLGQAIRYMLKRWDKLTLFLREPGAPLDNNACQQILKQAVRHRRNSLFYKTERGALVGDLFMSLLETCRFCGANPLDYFTALQKHARLVNEHPEQWLPWNYQAALAAANTS